MVHRRRAATMLFRRWAESPRRMAQKLMNSETIKIRPMTTVLQIGVKEVP